MTTPTVRTRIEPSPSGSLHVGNALTAAFNWLWARKHDGVFVLRIADTDAARVTPEGIRSALEDLRWLGLVWDEGPEVEGPHAPYFQSQRGDLYAAAATRLLDGGHAYRCYCTPAELEAMRERARAEKRPPRYEGRCRDLGDAERAAFEAEGRSSVIRFRVPAGETRMTDLVRGEVVFDHAQVEDFVIMRADGSALYNLTAAHDDLAMGMTHIIRGEDIYPSTPKQVLIMRALGATEVPVYAHLPLLVGPDRQKLSKRHGATSVAAYRTMGILPEVLVNYLAILDWSIGDGVTERFTIPELTAAFDPSRITRNPSAFDPQKLEAMNGERIRELSVDELVARLEPACIDAGVLAEPVSDQDRAALRAITPHIQERMKRLDEVAQIRFLFADVEPDEKAAGLLTPAIAGHLETVAGIVEALDPWTAATITDALMAWADGSGMKRKAALQPLRAAVTGSTVSPPLFESIEVLGRARAVQRLRAAAERARG